MHQQFAKFAHDLVNTAQIRGGDAENVTAVKKWLRDIAEGKLVVGAQVSEDKPAGTEPAE